MPNEHVGRAVDAVAFARQLDRSEEFPIAGRFRVTTASGSVYDVDDDALVITKSDGQVFTGHVNGSTFGGSMLLSGRLLPGALMEFVVVAADRFGQAQTYTTTPIVSIEVLP